MMPGCHRNSGEISFVLSYEVRDKVIRKMKDQRGCGGGGKNMKNKLTSLRNVENCWAVLCVSLRLVTIYCALSRLGDFLEKCDLEEDRQYS